MHRRVYIPFSDSHLPVNHLHDIKLNQGKTSNLCSPHTSTTLPSIVDNMHVERYWGANVGVGRWLIMTLADQTLPSTMTTL